MENDNQFATKADIERLEATIKASLIIGVISIGQLIEDHVYSEKVRGDLVLDTLRLLEMYRDRLLNEKSPD